MQVITAAFESVSTSNEILNNVSSIHYFHKRTLAYVTKITNVNGTNALGTQKREEFGKTKNKKERRVNVLLTDIQQKQQQKQKQTNESFVIFWKLS